MATGIHGRSWWSGQMLCGWSLLIPICKPYLRLDKRKLCDATGRKNLCCWSWQMLRKKLQINLHHGPWESGLHLSSTDNKQGESFGLCRHSSIKAEERGRNFRKCRFWTILEHRGLSLLHHQSWTNVNMDLQSYQPHPSHSSHDPKFSSLGAKWSQSCGRLIVKRC